MDQSEIICISSDEDDSMQKDNRNNPSSIERNELLSKCTKELLSNENDGKGDNSNKRKALQMDDDNKSPVDKKMKCTVVQMKCNSPSKSVVNNAIKRKRVVLNLLNDVTLSACTTFVAKKNIEPSVSVFQNIKDNVVKVDSYGEIHKQCGNPVSSSQGDNQSSDKSGLLLSSAGKSILSVKSLRDDCKNIVEPCTSAVSPERDIVEDRLASYVEIAKPCSAISDGHDIAEDKQASNANLEIQKKVVKPKLIIKEKRSIDQEQQDVFPMFISLCLHKDRSEDMKKIVSKLKRRYEQLDPAYARSEAFKDFLNEKRNAIVNSSNKLFIHIVEVMTEMKSRCKNKSQLSINNQNHKMDVSNSGTNISKINYDEHEEEQIEDRVLERKIRPILKTMEKCEKYIKKLEEAEVDFDDENNSNYMKLEKYKLRMVELYNKYCEYTGDNPDAGRPYLRPKHINTTSIVTVDQAIISFINSKISRRNKLKRIGALPDAVIFPDYTDILQCVTRCNDLHNLGLDKKKQHEMAKKAFTELGQYLQRCRRNDYWDTFSLFLENKEDDPAMKDPTLAEQLRKNRVEGEKKLSNIFQMYVKKQEEMKDQQSNTKTPSDDEEDEDNSMDNEDEDEDEYEDNSCNEESVNVGTDILSIDEDKMSMDKDLLRTAGDDILVRTAEKHIKDDEISIESTKTGKDVIEIVVGAKKSNDKPQVNDVLSSITDKDRTMDKTDITKKDTASNSNIVSSTQTPETVSLLHSSSTNDRIEENVAASVSEDGKNDGESEGEKPLLRVRSFAKPPTTWEDGKQKMDSSLAEQRTSNDVAKETIVDLTKEPSKQDNHTTSTALQNGSKPRPAAKHNYKTYVVQQGKTFVNIKDITKTYMKLHPRITNTNFTPKTTAGRELSSVHRVTGVNCGQPRFIRLPLTTDQRTSSARSTVTNIQLNRNDTTVLQIIQPSPAILIQATSLGQNVSNSLTSDSSRTTHK